MSYRAAPQNHQFARRAKREGVLRITLSPWGAPLYVFKGIEGFPEKFRRIFGVESQLASSEEDEVGGFFGVEVDQDGYAINVLVISEAFEDYPEEFIWHEALHATFIILAAYGVKFDDQNHEVYNYTQGYIVSEIRQALYGKEGFGR